MNQPWIYMYSTSRSPLPHPSLPDSSGSSQCTRPEHLSQRLSHHVPREGRGQGISPSLVAQMVKNLPAKQETQVQSLGQEDPLEKGMATHSSILAWRISWTEEPCRLQSIRLQRVWHDWVITLFVSGIFLGNSCIFSMEPAPGGQMHLASYFLQVSLASRLLPPFSLHPMGYGGFLPLLLSDFTSFFPVWVSVPPIICRINSLN